MREYALLSLLIAFIYVGESSGQSFKATDTLSSIYDSSGCGLNYAQASVVLGQKMVFNGVPFPGVVQPANFVISGIPVGAVIEKAYLWWDITGSDTTGSVIIQNPASAIDTVAGSLLGSGGIQECWGVGAAAFRADVTSSVTGNGNYIISGLPNDSIASDSTADANGATLFIIYSEPEASFTGFLNINDGFYKAKFGTVTQTISNLSISDTSDMATAIILISDLQGESGNVLKFNNGAYSGVVEEFWDFEEKSTVMLPAQTSSTFGVQVPNDCANFIMIGLYYQVNGTTTTPTISQQVDTLSSSIGSSYQWYHEDSLIVGATNQSFTVTQNGNYTVWVGYESICLYSSASFWVNCVESFQPTVLSDSGSFMWTTDTVGFTYQWFIDSVAIDSATSSSYLSNETGNFLLQTTDSLGCVALSDTFLVDSITIGLVDISFLSGLHVYPNPSRGVITISTSGFQPESLRLEVLSIDGSLIRRTQWKTADGSKIIDLSDETKGVYFLRFSNQNGVSVAKIVRL